MKPRKTGETGLIAVIRTKSPEETQQAGADIGRSLNVPAVVLLRGSLGAGKTTLTRGIAQGLGVEDTSLVNSPSFTLVNVYQGACPIYHVDLYRLEGDRDLYSIGLDDFIGNEGVTVVEWSERLADSFDDATVVEIEDAGDDERILHIRAPGKRRRRK
jgi:tRNA threonylcarbamoyladenosine biosynthesis protein TsaE